MRKKNRVLLIGGEGFLGSHICNELLDQGYSVIIVDIQKESYSKNKKLTYVRGDISDITLLNKLIKQVSIVYHFAGIASIEYSIKNPSTTINQNIINTVNIVELCIKNKIEKFIFASSLYVYNNFGSFYRATKQACELIIQSYGEQFDLKYIFLRYGSLYGSNAQSWNGIMKYVTSIYKDKKITYNGSGNEKREYIHVKDAAKISVEVLKNKVINKAFIITGNQNYTSKEILKMIFEILNLKENIKFTNKPSEYHYYSTPYRYNPISANKLTVNNFRDIGQGILEIIHNIEKKDD